MRKFKYIGNNLDGFNPMFEKNVIYNEDFSLGVGYSNVGRIAQRYPHDWEEVFGEQVDPPKKVEPTTLHKDTDLGYFAGLALQGIHSNPDWVKTCKIEDDWEEYVSRSVSAAIDISKELIKQLDEHRSNNPL